MKLSPFQDRREALFVGVLLLATAVLALTNLGAAQLWQDEAQTAVIARTVLTHGVPLGSDGTNYFSQEDGVEYGPGHRWRWHTWLPFYLVAGSFALLGQGTESARFPFALFGIATIVGVYFLGRRLWRDRWAASASAILLAGSVPFLVLSRQCRYYSMAAFFLVLAVWAYLRLVEKDRLAGAVLALALVGLFQSHYVYLPPLIACLALHAWVFHRDRLRAAAVWTAAAGVVCLPSIVWLSDIRYADRYGAELADASRILPMLGAFVALIFEHVFPAFLLIIAALAFAWSRLRRGREQNIDAPTLRSACLLALLLVSTLLVLAIVSPAPFFRYLSPLLPLLALAAGRVVAAPAAAPWPWKLGLTSLLVALGPVVPFLGELRHDFDGPGEAIVRYLAEHADPQDLVAISYGDMPLKFYTSHRVLGGLTGEDLEAARSADWIIVRRHVVAPTKDGEVARILRGYLRQGSYRRIVLGAIDTRFENREEPALHRFSTATAGAPVVLYRRIDPARIRTRSASSS